MEELHTDILSVMANYCLYMRMVKMSPKRFATTELRDVLDFGS